MLDPQAPTLLPRVAAKSCPGCQSRMEVQRIAAAVPIEHWTMRCASCGLIRAVQVDADPMKSDAVGWEHSDLRVPQQGR